jgi:hypothetical protein
MSSGIVKKVRPRGRPPKSSFPKVEPIEHVEVDYAPPSPEIVTGDTGTNIIRNYASGVGSMSLRPNKRVKISKALKRLLESDEDRSEDDGDFEDVEMGSPEDAEISDAGYCSIRWMIGRVNLILTSYHLTNFLWERKIQLKYGFFKKSIL